MHAEHAEKIASKRILIVRTHSDEYDDVMDMLARYAQVESVTSLDEAVQAVGKQKFDFVLSDISNFVPLEKALVAQQASTVLEAIGQMVCVVDREGKFVWANKRLDGMGHEVKTKVADCCREILELLPASDDPAAMLRSRHFSLSVKGDRYYEVTAAPILSAGDEVRQVAAIISDVTPARRLQRKIDAIDRAGRELVRLDVQQIAQLDFAERLALLEEKIVRYIRDLMNFSNFVIWILDPRTQKLELLINYELPPESVEIDLYASTEGNGICGYVAATGRSYICPDVCKDPRYLPGIESAGSSLTVPLWLDEQVRGVLDVESVETAAFTEDDRQFAEIFGRYIAIALNTFDLLVTERVTTTGHLAQNVQTEISAPLNDIIADASTLMEEYIGNEDLRRRLQTICDNVMSVKQSVKSAVEPPRDLLGGRHVTPEVDPLLWGKRVIVADDEEAIRDTIRDVLESKGCTVETARDGTEAVSMLAERSYDMVLSDIKMPKKNGYQVFSAAKDKNPGCPVILMTGFGYDPNHSIIRARKEGLAAVLFKPFKVEQLLNEMRSAMRVSS